MNQAIGGRVERFAAIACLLSDHYRVAIDALICTARSFWDTGLNPTPRWRLVEAAVVEMRPG